MKKRRNPLKSGQCFLREIYREYEIEEAYIVGRNPLKSGQCFLPDVHWEKPIVIPLS